MYLFNESAGGWSSETENAKLVESDGQAGDQFGGLVAMSGGTVVVGRSAARGTALYVFTEPVGGWSGTIQETAQLIATQPTSCGLQALAISGDTIVVSSNGGCTFSPTVRVVDVFTRPPGGWSGAIDESAQLTTPSSPGQCFSGQGGVAIDAQTIAVACPSAAYVFNEPASGWTGTIQPGATLGPNQRVGSVAVLGSSVVVGLTGNSYPSYPTDPVVFDKPASGWAGTIRPAATLKVSGAGAGARAYIQSVVGAGNEIATVAMPESNFCDLGACGATLFAFSEPPGGWKGTIAGSSAPIGAAAYIFPLAIDGPTIATGGIGAIDVFTIRPGTPSLHNASLSGIATGTPKLRLTLNAGLNAAPIRSLTLSLPRGLGFARPRPRRTAGIHVNAPFRTVRARPDTVTFMLRSAAENLAVTISRPAIIEQTNLRAKAQRIRRYNRTHRHERSLTITIRVVVSDTTHHTTRLTLKARIS